jgi:hypothetical protein
MKLLSVLQAQSVKAIRVNGSYGYLPELISALRTRYHFVGGPQPVDIVAASPVEPANTPARPLVFTQGVITLEDRQIAIQHLQVFQAGLIVTTLTNTNDSDLVVRDIIQWASSLNIQLEELKPSVGHSSQLDFKLDKPLSQLFVRLLEIGPTITQMLEPFWEQRPGYELTGVTFHYDTTKYPTFSPPMFRIERRAQQSFDTNIFWSEAPLSTDNHVALLRRFEELLK